MGRRPENGAALVLTGISPARSEQRTGPPPPGGPAFLDALSTATAARRPPVVARHRYLHDSAPFTTLPERPDDGDRRDLAEYAGPGSVVAVTGLTEPPPAGWEIVLDGAGVQRGVDARPDAEAVRLGPADVPEMLALVERTRPVLPRTVEMGTYLGLRSGGALVAKAGERLHPPPGWTEISAVCTDGAHRGHGIATRLVRAVAAGIRVRGEAPFLHAATNTDAIRLHESVGFRLRRDTRFVAVRTSPAPARRADPRGATAGPGASP